MSGPTDYIPARHISPALGAYLDRMLASGLYGESFGELVDHLLMVGAQDAIARGLIRPPAEEEEEDDGTAEGEAPAAAPGLPCAHTVEDVDCGAPGCEGLPF